MEIKKAKIGNALTSSAANHVVAVSEDIYDESKGRYQSDINEDAVKAKIVADKAAADIGVDSITLLQGGIDSDGSENSSSYYLRTGRYSTFKLDINDGYTVGQLAQYDLYGNFVALHSDYTQPLEGVDWSSVKIVVTDKNYYWVAIVFKGDSPTDTTISPQEDVVKTFLSGLYLFAEGGEGDSGSSAAKAKAIARQEINTAIDNLPNEEDLTLVEGKMQMANRAAVVNDDKVSSLGYVILRPDKSFAEQVVDANTIYEVRYEFDLGGETVILQENCVLKFVGGKIDNGTLQCADTTILGEISCLGLNLKTKGTHSSIDLSWLGVYGNNSDNSAILKTLDRFSSRNFYLSIDCTCSEGNIILPTHTTINGDGHSIRYSGNEAFGFLCLNDDSRISNLIITSTNKDYTGALILADTQVSKVHQFWLSDIQLGGVWVNASTPNNVTGIKIVAHNTEGLNYLTTIDENNYISGCILRNIDCRYVNEAINIECVNYAKIVPSEGVAQYNRFAWLNDIYIETLYASADKAIKTLYTDYAKVQNNIDNGANNPSDSCGHLMLQNVSFQRWATNGMMFYHEGNWDLNILNGMNWDSTYKGVIIGGTVRATNLRGSYQKDTIGLTDDLGTYDVVDSVKIYNNGKYYKDSALLKTYDSYRQKNYNPDSAVQKWDVGVLKNIAYGIKAQHHGFTFFANSANRINTQKDTEAFSYVETSIYNNETGSGREDFYRLHYAPQRHTSAYLSRYFRMPKIIDTAYEQNLIASNGLKETYSCLIYSDKLGLSEYFQAGTCYKIRITPTFNIGDGSYKDFLTVFNNITYASPNIFVVNGEIKNSTIVRTSEEFYIECVLVLYSTSRNTTVYFDIQYSHVIKPENITIGEDDEILITNMQMFAKEFNVEFIESFNIKGDSENRPSNKEIGFQYFDTTLSKPIWWTGEKWVDSTGTEV